MQFHERVEVLVGVAGLQPAQQHLLQSKRKAEQYIMKKNRNIEVKLSVLLGNYDRPAKQPTDGPTDQQTRPGS